MAARRKQAASQDDMRHGDRMTCHVPFAKPGPLDSANEQPRQWLTVHDERVHACGLIGSVPERTGAVAAAALHVVPSIVHPSTLTFTWTWRRRLGSQNSPSKPHACVYLYMRDHVARANVRAQSVRCCPRVGHLSQRYRNRRLTCGDGMMLVAFDPSDEH
ncbi:hypothetical protein E4U21_005647 [Claviceps maximensis]|nr:hypothetical protein E4U21_005647 [Claviceps maximensis]